MYQGVGVTPDDYSQQEMLQNLWRSGSAKGYLKIEPCMILTFVKDKNECIILTSENETIPNIRVLNTLDEILSIYGNPNHLQNLTANLYYEDEKRKGFVKIENTFEISRKEGVESYEKPFYL